MFLKSFFLGSSDANEVEKKVAMQIDAVWVDAVQSKLAGNETTSTKVTVGKCGHVLVT